MRPIGKVTPAMQAPESGSGATSVKAEKKQRAEHDLLDDKGEVVEDEENANGIRYTLLGMPNRPFTYQYGQNPATDKLLAIFGAKTLATNESSAVRNSPKGAGTADEQIEAVEARFALLGTGKWVDRTREGVTVDLDTYAQAMINVQVRQGMYEEAIGNTEKLPKMRALLDDKAQLAKARKVSEFATEYAKLKGAAIASVNDFTV